MCASFGEALELRVPSKPEYVAIVRTFVTDMARRIALSSSAVEDVRVAASEACANVVCHAYSDSGRSPDRMLVRCTASDGRLIIEVADNGRGMKSVVVPACAAVDEGGLGLLLMRGLMDQVSVNSGPKRGTTVRMVKNLDRRPVSQEARLPQEKVEVPAAL